MRIVLTLAASLSLATATSALAVTAPAIDFSLGLGGATLEDSFPEIDNSANTRFNFTYSFAPFEAEERFRLGFGVSLEGSGETGRRVEDESDSRISERPYSRLFAFTPEVRFAWSQPLGERWFIEPNVAIALPIANYSVGEIETYRRYNEYYFVDDDQTRVGIGVRPGLMVGYWLAPRHAIGLDLTYLYSSIDFRGVGPEYEAFSVGVFYRLAF